MGTDDTDDRSLSHKCKAPVNTTTTAMNRSQSADLARTDATASGSTARMPTDLFGGSGSGETRWPSLRLDQLDRCDNDSENWVTDRLLLHTTPHDDSHHDDDDATLRLTRWQVPLGAVSTSLSGQLIGLRACVIPSTNTLFLCFVGRITRGSQTNTH